MNTVQLDIWLRVPAWNIGTLLIFVALVARGSAIVRTEDSPTAPWPSAMTRRPDYTDAVTLKKQGSNLLDGSFASFPAKTCSLEPVMDLRFPSKHRRVPVEKKIVLINRRHEKTLYQGM